MSKEITYKVHAWHISCSRFEIEHLWKLATDVCVANGQGCPLENKEWLLNLWKRLLKQLRKCPPTKVSHYNYAEYACVNLCPYMYARPLPYNYIIIHVAKTITKDSHTDTCIHSTTSSHTLLFHKVSLELEQSLQIQRRYLLLSYSSVDLQCHILVQKH